MPGYRLPPDADIDSDYRHDATARGFVPVGTPQGGKWHYDVRGRRGEPKRPHHRDLLPPAPTVLELKLRNLAAARIVNLLNGLPPDGLPTHKRALTARAAGAGPALTVPGPIRPGDGLGPSLKVNSAARSVDARCDRAA